MRKSASIVVGLLVAGGLLASLPGCLGRDLGVVAPCVISSTRDRVSVENVDKVDLLFIIDNSGSMKEEQDSLRRELPSLVAVLASGVRADGSTFTPVRDLAVGVVSTDMGVGLPENTSCEVSPLRGDDGVLLNRGDTSISGCMATYTPPYLGFRPADGGDATAFGNSVGCIASLGINGCGFEQQLEATLKAVTPSTSAIRFSGETLGHADGANNGFLRDDALLAILMVTDEEDCSASDPDLFNPSSARYMGSPNLKCFIHAGEEDGLNGGGALHPLSRYVDGLIATKASPNLVVFAAITGIPTRLSGQSFSAMLEAEEMRAVPDPDCDLPVGMRPTGCPRLRPSCNVPGLGLAFPPRRLVRTAQLIDSRGGSSVIESICQADFGPALRAIIDKIADQLGGACLPRALNPEADGTVDCDVVEQLPAEGDLTRCDQLPGREMIGSEDGRQLCRVAQIPDGSAPGWFYDNSSTDVLERCGDTPQRISFVTGSEPRTGTDVRLECLQPVSDSGQVTFGSVCETGEANPCAGPISGLSCNADTNTCQLSCDNDSMCPSGMKCDTVTGAMYCVVPTCN